MPYKHDQRYRAIGGRHRTSSRYAMILNRVKTACLRRRNSGYRNIKVKISREDFIQWFQSRDFAGCSVDRIDPSGDYEFSNIQVIPLWQNIGKDKLKAIGSMCICYRCKANKPLTKFVRSSRRRILGIDTICKPCDSEHKRRST